MIPREIAAEALRAILRDDEMREILRAELPALLPLHPASEREWFTVAEAADYLRVSPRTLERLLASGDIRSTTVERRRIIRREWLDEYATAGEDVAPTTPPRRRANTLRRANHALGGQHAR